MNSRPRRIAWAICCRLQMATGLLFFLLTFTGGSLLDAAQQAPTPVQVLILNSYHHGYTWTDRELDGVRDAFAGAGIKADIHVEFMDSKNFPKNEQFEQLSALYAFKYHERRPALVMTLDNPAFEFAIKYRHKLFRGIPIVFAGLNDYAPAMLHGERDVTGVVERQDIAGTVRLARKLQPEVKEVVILHDFTASGLASRREAEEQLAPLVAEVNFRYLPDMTIEEVVATLKTLKAGTVVLPFSFSRDRSGRIFNHAELTEILGKNSPVPVYGTKEERLGYGIIGGSLLEGKSHGALGAGLALRLLRGETADSLPVITEPVSRIIFDYNVLQKFGINTARLPQPSIVINARHGFYRQHALVINVAGTIILLLAGSLVIVLIANRRRLAAEEALIEAERSRAVTLEVANREMESFCYAVSHDLQAPLRHIKSFSAIIEEECSNLDPAVLQYLDRIKGATVKMSDLIRDLLKLSQISLGELHRQEFDLGELAGEVFAELLLHEETRNIKMIVDKGLGVSADKKLVRVVLDNLIGNAWKYTSKTPEALIHLGVRQDRHRRLFFIADNGAGFDMQYAEKLFTPFQRLHSETEFEGSGIGLATVQRIINRHGGEIWAEANPGKGATFIFTLQP